MIHYIKKWKEIHHIIFLEDTEKAFAKFNAL